MTGVLNFELPAGEDDVELLFKLLLARPVNNDDYKRRVASQNIPCKQLARQILESPEFEKRFLAKRPATKPPQALTGEHLYRAPDFLRVSASESHQVLMIGSCLMNEWSEFIKEFDPDLRVKRVTFNNASELPEMTTAEASEYSFQILQIPLRSIIPEGMYFGLRYHDGPSYDCLLSMATVNLENNLRAITKYSRDFNLTTFVLNFPVPQQNPMGRLCDRYSLNNMVFFVEELNRLIYTRIRQTPHCYSIDFDQIVATFGRKYFQDDSVMHVNHGSYLHRIDASGDKSRLEPVGDVQSIYGPNTGKVIKATYQEVLAAYRSIRQEDSVKIVIFDLDDTLWRGVAADSDDIGPHMAEGWPLGILEAVSYLWRRGILVALVSKNDEANVVRVWKALYEKKFPLANFVLTKINWKPKPQNIADILEAVNLMPQSCLFIDDNPVERAGVRQAFPAIRVLDQPLANWRRALLWSPETQLSMISNESGARTSMIQAQIRRDELKSSVDHNEFLASLKTSIEFLVIESEHDPRYQRCFELINKTNQYNTTGRRWSPGELGAVLARGGFLLAASVGDQFTDYGIVAVAVVSAAAIVQFVMSCRVFGMEIEFAVISMTIEMIRRRGYEAVTAQLTETGKNALCLGLYRNSGFTETNGGKWEISPVGQISMPRHIRIAEPATEPA